MSPALKGLDETILSAGPKGREAEETLKESEISLGYLAEQLLTVQENEPKRLASKLLHS